MFSDSEYRKRALIEGIFGAEETRRHHALPVRPEGQPAPVRQGKGDRLEHPGNRFECANRLNIPNICRSRPLRQ